MASASSTAPGVKIVAHGVAPLRAGQGFSFALRRLHSLSGIIPVGAFLFEHILISNATAITGSDAYANQVRLLANLPLVSIAGFPALELFGIWLPILFHALYGFYIWYRGDGNAIAYPWSGNWMYTAQRWTGGIAFVYIVWHTYTMRFTGVDLHAYPNLSFGKVQAEVIHPAPVPVLHCGTGGGFVALRVWHLAVLGEVGDCFGGQGAETIVASLPGVFPGAVRGGICEFVFVPHAAPQPEDQPNRAIAAIQPHGRPDCEQIGRPVR